MNSGHDMGINNKIEGKNLFFGVRLTKLINTCLEQLWSLQP